MRISTSRQGGTSCTNLQTRFGGFFQFMRIFEDFWYQMVKARPAIGGKKAVLSLQSSFFTAKSSMPKNNVFAQKNMIYGILVANVTKIST